MLHMSKAFCEPILFMCENLAARLLNCMLEVC